MSLHVCSLLERLLVGSLNDDFSNKKMRPATTEEGCTSSVWSQPLSDTHSNWKSSPAETVKGSSLYCETLSAAETLFRSFLVDGIVCLLCVLPLLVLIALLLEAATSGVPWVDQVAKRRKNTKMHCSRSQTRTTRAATASRTAGRLGRSRHFLCTTTPTQFLADFLAIILGIF